MIVTNPSVLIPEAPTIDTSEAIWASNELTAILEKLDPESPVSLVLRQARRELVSLVSSGAARVIGPFRVAA